MIDVHPDHLLDRARRGTLDAEGRRQLDAHLAVCRGCALELQLLADFAEEGEPTEDDEAILARALAKTSSRPQPRRATAWLFAAAALLVAAFAFARSLHPTPPPKPVESPVAPVAVPAPVLPSAAASVTPPPPPVEASAEKPVDKPKLAPKAIPSAAELFAQANEARRTGAVGEAVRLYRALQSQHPASSEASTSRVSLGRLLLDKAGDASGARAQFRAYLAASPDGTLAEEARVGLARSAAALGDAAGERSAWEDLLAHHPESVHAFRARKRLAELGP